jgi:hypothetical protein
MLTDAQIDRLQAARFTIGRRSGDRQYLRYDGADVGYITAADLDGSTGTCSHITRRAGSVAAALRG